MYTKKRCYLVTFFVHFNQLLKMKTPQNIKQDLDELMTKFKKAKAITKDKKPEVK